MKPICHNRAIFAPYLLNCGEVVSRRVKTMWTLKFKKVRKSNEDGAVTVDWVVLTAAVVGISLLGGFPLIQPLLSATSSVASGIANYDP